MIQISGAAQILTLLSLFYAPDPSNVLAYLDPGSGSYLLQLLLAAALGGLLLLRHYWAKVKSSVRRLFFGKGEELDADE